MPRDPHCEIRCLSGAFIAQTDAATAQAHNIALFDELTRRLPAISTESPVSRHAILFDRVDCAI